MKKLKHFKRFATIALIFMVVLSAGTFSFQGRSETEAFDPSVVVTETCITYQSTLDNLNLRMDVSYNPQNNHAPIVLVLHGYSNPFPGEDIIERLAQKGVFAIKTYKRGSADRGIVYSEGVSDDSARESRDFVDAVEYVKANFSQYVDPENVNVIGYSGGGGNAYSLLGKFPDYFRSAAIFYGMSDYGDDETYGWYNNGAAGGAEGNGVGDYRPIIESRIGGSPSVVPANYRARDMNLAAKNNPYTKIHLFYDQDEKICPVTHAEQYIKSAAGFTNIVSHISNNTTYSKELQESFGSTPWGWSLVGSEGIAIKQTRGFLYWSTWINGTEGIYAKKFQSLRYYKPTDNLTAKFEFKINSAQEKSAVLFGFRNSDDTTLKNSLGVVVAPANSQLRLSLRADYDGTPFVSGNRNLRIFNTRLALGQTYYMTMELKGQALTVNIKDGKSVNETVTLPIDQAKSLKEVNSFAISSYNNGAGGMMNGRIDNLAVSTYTRWIHAMPHDSASSTAKSFWEDNIVAENYFIPDIVSGKYPKPSLDGKGTMYIPGYVVTKHFEIMLEDGKSKSGELEYDINDPADASSASAGTREFKVTSHDGPTSYRLLVKNLRPNTAYTVVADGNPESAITLDTDTDGALTINDSLSGDSVTYMIYD